MQSGIHFDWSTCFATENELGTGELPHPPQACEASLTECMETRSTCYAKQRLLHVDGHDFKSEAGRALLVAVLNARAQSCESSCAGQFGMGIRPLFHVKLKLMKHNIPLPRCSIEHEPKLRWPVDSVKIVNPHLAPTASACGMRTGAQGTNAAGYVP